MHGGERILQLAERIGDIVRASGLKPSPFAQKHGFHPSAFLKYLKEGRVPDPAQLVKLADIGDVTLDWLLTGQGPKHRGERLMPPTAELVVVAPEELEGRLRRRERLESYLPVPLVADRAAAGDPLFVNDDDIEGFALIYKDWLRAGGNYSCIRIRGKSMVPVLGDGDLVAVNHARRDPRELRRKIAALLVEGEGVTIKYVELVKDHLHVWAENRADWEPRVMGLDQVQIVGAVEWAWRRFE
jgi:phage repressor protein C with HTH and peptisase S24 domain